MTGSIKVRPSKTKRLMSMFKPINHCIIHHYQKEKKSFLRRKKASEGPLRLLFRFHSDRVFFRFFSDRVHLRVLSDRVLFESSVIDSSLGSSVLFFRHVAIFLSKLATTFLIKNRSPVLHYIFKKIFALITVSSKKNQEILTR